MNDRGPPVEEHEEVLRFNPATDSRPHVGDVGSRTTRATPRALSSISYLRCAADMSAKARLPFQRTTGPDAIDSKSNATNTSAQTPDVAQPPQELNTKNAAPTRISLAAVRWRLLVAT